MRCWNFVPGSFLFPFLLVSFLIPVMRNLIIFILLVVSSSLFGQTEAGKLIQEAQHARPWRKLACVDDEMAVECRERRPWSVLSSGRKCLQGAGADSVNTEAVKISLPDGSNTQVKSLAQRNSGSTHLADLDALLIARSRSASRRYWFGTAEDFKRAQILRARLLWCIPTS